jgi:hypothetical protein
MAWGDMSRSAEELSRNLTVFFDRSVTAPWSSRSSPPSPRSPQPRRDRMPSHVSGLGRGCGHGGGLAGSPGSPGLLLREPIAEPTPQR